MAITADRRSSETYYWDVNTLDWVKGTQPSGGGGGDASAANQVLGNASLSSIDTKIGTAYAVNGAATEKVIGVNLRFSGVGGSTEAGTSGAAFRVDPTGNTTQPVSISSLPSPSASGTVTLGALNDAAFTTSNMANSIGGHLAAGTLTGTITFEATYDGSSTWTTTNVVNLLTGAVVSSIALTNPNVAQHWSYILAAQMTSVRVRISVYTSGSAVVRLNASDAMDSYALAGVTQPVSLATLPALVAGSAVIGHVIADTGSTTTVTGNVTVIQGTGTNLHTVVDSGTVTANAGSNLNTSLLTLETTQVTGNSTLSTINTNTAPLIVAAAGGYVRQDSTATIAKESGGNLATLVTNTTGIATAANQILTQATSGSTTAPSKIDVVGGITSADTPQFLPLPLTPLGIAVATQEYNDPSDILLLNLLTEMRLMRQAFQDWSGADPRYDLTANYNFQ